MGQDDFLENHGISLTRRLCEAIRRITGGRNKNADTIAKNECFFLHAE
jgi:hypothetical protein